MIRLNQLRAALTATVICAASFALSVVSDLKTDFSNTLNPNGRWILTKDIGVRFLSTVSDYWNNSENQIAWCDQPFPQNAHVPFWMKVSTVSIPGGQLDVQIGDIMMHGAVNSRTGSTDTSALWISNITGPITISGNSWLAIQRGRKMDWQLWKNSTMLSSGSLLGDSSTSRANPALFQNGSGGPSVLVQQVVPGDKIELRFHSVDELPEIAGVNFKITPWSVDTFTIMPSGVVAGNFATGSIILNAPAPVGGIDVILTDNSAALNTPPSLHIEEGQSSGTFQIGTTVTSVEIMRQVKATINKSVATRNLVVLLPDLTSVTANPKTVVGGNPSTGTLTANGLAGNGFVVNLSSSGPQIVVPGSVTFTYGQSTANFTINTMPVTGTQVKVITATRNGRSRTVTMTILKP